MEDRKIRRQYFISLVFVLLLIVGCKNNQPSIEMNEVLVHSEEKLKGTAGIETIASAFDGKSIIKFRLMVKESQTEEKAEILFNKILESIVKFSNHPDVWNYYNGYFDIKDNNNCVIYEATKLIGEDLVIMPAKEHIWESSNMIVHDNETYSDASLNDTPPSEQAALISDEKVMEQVEYFQKHLKIGADRDTLTNHFKHFLREPIFNESGDSPYKDGESYAFTTLDDPYELEINETIHGRESDATIIDIFDDGDYLIKYEHNEKEATLQPKTLRVMLDRLIPNFVETRKIGVIAHVFFDQNDLVTFAYLTFVHGSENNVYRIGYMPDGTVTFTIN